LLFVEPFFLFVLLPLALCAFYAAGSYAGKTASLIVIVAVSAVFYAPYGILAATLLASSLCINLVIGISLSQTDHAAWRKILLSVGLFLNFAALGTFKYFDQLVDLG
jgi:D-alanyl-lipoteichoic acid acyltransferase DltB (MBOAT superfamily)